jgi:hypothetical protein
LVPPPPPPTAVKPNAVLFAPAAPIKSVFEKLFPPAPTVTAYVPIVTDAVDVDANIPPAPPPPACLCPPDPPPATNNTLTVVAPLVTTKLLLEVYLWYVVPEIVAVVPPVAVKEPLTIIQLVPSYISSWDNSELYRTIPVTGEAGLAAVFPLAIVIAC